MRDDLGRLSVGCPPARDMGDVAHEVGTVGHPGSATAVDAEYVTRGRRIGDLVSAKQAQYGDSVTKSQAILAALYPNGVAPHQYADVLLMTRVIDKLSRIAQRGPDGKDLGGESPWQAIAGYGLLGWRKDER